MKELVICSGKGGTGKTSVTAAFATLAENKVLADTDVDAADLHLILNPEVLDVEIFHGGKEAFIVQNDCDACGLCHELCQFEAIGRTEDAREILTFTVDALRCEGCGVCVHFCPSDAINFPVSDSGKMFVSETRSGTMVHARLIPGAENSGKLVTKVREKAREIAENGGFDLLVVDGPPGIGCPVTAAITNTDLLLAVTEPGVSARHDLLRLMDLAKTFQVPVAVCINKSDLNPEMTRAITNDCQHRNIPVVGLVPFDSSITQAQLQGRSVVEIGDSPASQALKETWLQTLNILNGEEK
jgi:MinD superfamily P-loop ATPase